jgi:hypothetical protein
MAVTSTTSQGPNIPTEIIDGLVLSYLRNAVVLTPMVRSVDISDIPGLKYDFNSFGSVSFASKSQGTDYTPAELTIGEDGTVTAAEVGLALQLPDILREANPNLSDDDLAREIANAAADKMETDICSQFTDFTTTKGTTGEALTIAVVEDALLALRQAKAPTTPQSNSNLPADLAGYFGVLAESGIAQLQRAIRQAGMAVMSPNTQRMLDTFGATAASAARFNFLGVNFFGQDLVATTGGDRNGAILCPAAIGLVVKRAPRLAKQRWEKGSEEHQVGSAVYGTDVIKQAFGVEILHLA